MYAGLAPHSARLKVLYTGLATHSARLLAPQSARLKVEYAGLAPHSARLLALHSARLKVQCAGLVPDSTRLEVLYSWLAPQSISKESSIGVRYHRPRLPKAKECALVRSPKGALTLPSSLLSVAFVLDVHYRHRQC